MECNRSLEEIAVEQRGAEAQEILEVYNHWIQEAIGEDDVDDDDHGDDDDDDHDLHDDDDDLHDDDDDLHDDHDHVPDHHDMCRSKWIKEAIVDDDDDDDD